MASLQDYQNFVAQGHWTAIENGYEWCKWLESASNTYKYGLDNSLAMYVQNPNTTMPASFVLWNNLNRKIHKGQKGMLVLQKEKIGYVFDISQTYGADVSRWTVADTVALTEYVNEKYDIQSNDFNEYLDSMTLYAIKDKENKDELFYSVKYMVSKRVGIYQSPSDVINLFDRLTLGQREKLLDDTYESAATVLRKVESHNREWMVKNSERKFTDRNVSLQTDRYQAGDANEGVSEQNADTSENKHSEIRTGGNGLHGEQSAEKVSEPDAIRRPSAAVVGDTDISSTDERANITKADGRSGAEEHDGVGESTGTHNAEQYSRTAGDEGSSADTEINERYLSEISENNGEPIVRVIWSENSALNDDWCYSLSSANKIFGRLDAEVYKAKQEQGVIGYDKTRFEIAYISQGQLKTYDGRQDFGDGEGTLIEHISGVADYYKSPNGITMLRTMHEDVDEYIKSLDEFLMYLKLHLHLSEMETAAYSALEELTNNGETALKDYYNSVVDYVKNSREIINKDMYSELPKMPQKDEFLGGEYEPWYEDYRILKAKYPDDILLFRMGDFYEMLEDDAANAAELLDIHLATRSNGVEQVKLCGIPKHTAHTYIDKLLVNGMSVVETSVDNEGYRKISRRYTPEPGIIDSINENGADIPLPTKFADEQTTISGDLVKYNFSVLDTSEQYMTKSKRYKANIKAIKTLKQIEAEQRFATPDEQTILSQYVGWGSLPEVFEERHIGYNQLKSLLSDAEYAAARASTLNAHYTPNIVISEMYAGLKNMGVTKGKFLESSCGIGKFMGLVPDEIQAEFYGVELDSLTGRIAQQLYQKNNIQIKGFEETAFKDNTFDVAIGNVPFGSYKISDVAYNKYNFLVHDYFFAKNIDKLRSGGIAALITTSGTLDKVDSKCRKYLAERADLIGAIRLPDNAFHNAGTEVTTDIIFLQKRAALRDGDYPDWVNIGRYSDEIAINNYFISHPEMMLGDMTLVSSRFGFDATCKARDGADLQAELHKAVMSLSAQITEREDIVTTEPENISNDIDTSGIRNLTYVEQDGKFYYNFNGDCRKVQDFKGVKAERIKGMHEIRQLTRRLIEIQSVGCTDLELEAAQKKLNQAYDKYVAKYGEIHSKANRNAFADDADLPLLLSLENVDEDGNITKADMFYKQTIRPSIPINHADTAIDGLKISLAEYGNVNIQYICRLTGKKEDEVITELKGLIYKNPVKAPNDMYEGYETADEYLSGNVLAKLETAKAMNIDGRYNDNVEALESVQLEPVSAADISWKIGLSWIDIKDYEQFMYETFETIEYHHKGNPWNAHDVIYIKHDTYNNTWTIYNKNLEIGNLKATTEFGTDRKNAYQIMEDSLNLQNCVVRDRHDDGDKVWYTVNSVETIKAQEKQELIRQKFSEWIMAHPDIRDKYTAYYNRVYNNTRLRQYDGSHLTFPGMSPLIKLREHQINGIARVLYSDTNTLLAHTVGAGKTYEMTASAMELKRLGLAKKTMFVVPNHLTEQWGSDFLQLYPGANILVATKKDFTKENRQAFFSKIAMGDWDAVIIGHSQFEKIPLSDERLAREINLEIEKITDAISTAKSEENSGYSVKQLESKKKNLETRYEELTALEKKDDIFNFEQLGVDYLFVDEAHMFKNCMITTKLHNIAGLSTTSAQKSMDMLWKCKYMAEINDGKGVVFATGTPISNSITEMYIMQRYLDNGLLEQQGFGFFDDWVAMFGNVTTGLELAPEGTGYRMKSRLSRFDNLPELMTMFSHFSDVQTADMLKLPVPEHEMHNIALDADEFTLETMMTYVERAKDIRNGAVEPEEDNMLKITNEARRLALDPQLISSQASQSLKLSSCAENVANIYRKTTDIKGTQLIFCDLGTPKDGIPLEETSYGRFIEQLVNNGIPRDEIAVIHDAKTDVQKAEMFSKVRNGTYRVLIGSTEKMGAGTNVQTHLTALHHLDCPWRSSDIEQREGRILRQGNMNDKVDIYRYVVKNTFDAYLWQIVENKQRFISQVMRGDIGVRNCEDMDETALSFAEIKACATGDIRIKEKMELDIKIQRLSALKAAHLKNKLEYENIIRNFPIREQHLTSTLQRLNDDIAIRNAHQQTEFSMTVNGTGISERSAAGQVLYELSSNAADETVFADYKGFKIKKHGFERLVIEGNGRYKIVISSDPVGITMRIDNAINGIEKHIETYEANLQLLKDNFAQAKENINKPFAREEELNQSLLRQKELDAELNMTEETSSMETEAELI